MLRFPENMILAGASGLIKSIHIGRPCAETMPARTSKNPMPIIILSFMSTPLPE
jgi:hypothetical protein